MGVVCDAHYSPSRTTFSSTYTLALPYTPVAARHRPAEGGNAKWHRVGGATAAAQVPPTAAAAEFRTVCCCCSDVAERVAAAVFDAMDRFSRLASGQPIRPLCVQRGKWSNRPRELRESVARAPSHRAARCYCAPEWCIRLTQSVAVLADTHDVANVCSELLTGYDRAIATAQERADSRRVKQLSPHSGSCTSSASMPNRGQHTDPCLQFDAAPQQHTGETEYRRSVTERAARTLREIEQLESKWGLEKRLTDIMVS